MVKTIWGLQDYYLNQLRKENISATFYLINGFQLKAVVKGFDNFIVLVDSDGRQQMIYKHAISTITPSKQFNIQVLSQDENEILVDDEVLLVQEKTPRKSREEKKHKRKLIDSPIAAPLLLNSENQEEEKQ
ncbi:MAG: RNA chaperone Hfq [Peptococcaceae bacterium]|jgi:host factor-I protein|nr:RNA chaperone Hfq [Peptococcaceae bacterium]